MCLLYQKLNGVAIHIHVMNGYRTAKIDVVVPIDAHLYELSSVDMRQRLGTL